MIEWLAHRSMVIHTIITHVNCYDCKWLLHGQRGAKGPYSLGSVYASLLRLKCLWSVRPFLSIPIIISVLSIAMAAATKAQVDALVAQINDKKEGQMMLAKCCISYLETEAA